MGAFGTQALDVFGLLLGARGPDGDTETDPARPQRTEESLPYLPGTPPGRTFLSGTCAPAPTYHWPGYPQCPGKEERKRSEGNGGAETREQDGEKTLTTLSSGTVRLSVHS